MYIVSTIVEEESKSRRFPQLDELYCFTWSLNHSRKRIQTFRKKLARASNFYNGNAAHDGTSVSHSTHSSSVVFFVVVCAFEIANMLTLTNTSIKKTSTAATLPAEKPEKWKDSEAKALLRLDIISKRAPATMIAKEVHALRPK
jgi:hypothetical protein